MLSRFKASGLFLFCRAAPWALAISLSAGCAAPASSPNKQGKAANPTPSASPASTQPASVDRDSEAVATVLAYADRVRTLQGAELTQEIARLADPSVPADQMRLAVALSQTRQLYDLVRAQELLQRVLANASAEARPLHPVARLLAARFSEQRRVEDLLDRQNQQLRDLQRRLEQTQEKLDALKEIERSLNSRPPAAPAAPPASRPRPPGS
ncbi:hypothetical protein [Polaromonas sp. A23]|uniref:hypothetical protein n=1 Tax=Polaromonas sp. A23 TaxID=1944133 RepID=UPI0009856EB7|nr:hypothetical protein [Polaromonas sp. A23]OOG37334.1 hypothetical protein B0B52_18235 [Polaromonas sp. A23]